MATYVIGDVQGCFEPLERLLSRVSFSARRDRVWLVGDLVNRGPDSLAVLRWAKRLGDAAVVVLGNHDLHLLARARGLRKPGRRDSLDAVLGAADLGKLVEWLRTRPLLHREGGVLMVHAGLDPRWSVAEAVRRARACEAALRAPDWEATLAKVTNAKEPGETLGEVVESAWVMTRVRICTRSGRPRNGFSGAPEEIPPGCLPWFAVPGRRSASATVVFGHWAALGLHLEGKVLGLDSGCVWGNALTALRLEDRAVFQVPARRDG